jgi:hypothetical protein
MAATSNATGRLAVEEAGRWFEMAMRVMVFSLVQTVGLLQKARQAYLLALSKSLR